METEASNDSLVSAELAPSASAEIEHQEPTSTCLPSRITQIFLYLGAIVIPLFGVSGLLIGLVFKYRVRHRPSPSQSSSISLETGLDEPHVYYVQLSATKLVLLASISSSIAAILSSFFLSLLSYSLASRLVKLSKTRSLEKLPPPDQFGLLILTLNGGAGALWKWVKYMFERKRGDKTVGVVKTSFVGLTTVNVLGYCPDRIQLTIEGACNPSRYVATLVNLYNPIPSTIADRSSSVIWSRSNARMLLRNVYRSQFFSNCVPGEIAPRRGWYCGIRDSRRHIDREPTYHSQPFWSPICTPL